MFSIGPWELLIILVVLGIPAAIAVIALVVVLCSRRKVPTYRAGEPLFGSCPRCGRPYISSDKYCADCGDHNS